MKKIPSKLIYSVLLLSLLSSFSRAECNFNLAKASGQYLLELEQAKKRSYQNSSVCEVFSQELEDCTKTQLNQLQKVMNSKEILGNYCQPHLPPYPMLDKALFAKGAKLFSWKENEGYFWYALIPDNNRKKLNKNKGVSDIMENKMSFTYLVAVLEQLPANINLYWNKPLAHDSAKELQLSFPSDLVFKKIETIASKEKLKLQIHKP